MIIDEIPKAFQPAQTPFLNDTVVREIENLARKGTLVEDGQYVVVQALANQMPYTFCEIGRIRRSACLENCSMDPRKNFDLDQFDLYYLHIIVWSKQKKEIAAACRLGRFDEITRRFGPSGLYTSGLFNYSRAFVHTTGPTLEFSKAFVRDEYRKYYSPASLLLKGVGQFISDNPRYRTLIASVSISNRYGLPTQELMLSFLKKNYYDVNLSRIVKPKIPVHSARARQKVKNALIHAPKIRELPGFQSTAEPGIRRLPAFAKQYVRFGGRITAFGIDPSSGGSITGLVYLDITKCRPGLLKHCMGESGLKRFSDYNQAGQDRAA